MTRGTTLIALIAASLSALFVVSGCAARRPLTQATPLEEAEARSTLARVRELGGDKIAPEPLRRAEALIVELESLRTDGGDAAEQRFTARLALSEARHALTTVTLKLEVERRGNDCLLEKQAFVERLHRMQQDNRRLEDHIDVLQRDLELTETEIVRTKARLKNLITRADASSMIAEAQILFHRASRETHSASTLSRCQELIEHAEEQLRTANYDAAAFFALKAQDLLRPARSTRP